MHSAAASAWVARFAPLVPAGEVLDLACGGGRHARLFAALGHPVLALDRDPAALAALGHAAAQLDRGPCAPVGWAPRAHAEANREQTSAWAQGAHPTADGRQPGPITPMQHDLEAEGSAWPFAPGRFAGIVVTNYLHRPLMPQLLASLAPDGVLIYETFAVGNEQFGRPSNPAFLLQPGELLAAAGGAGLRVIAYEHGLVGRPQPAMVQRLCACGPAFAPTAAPLDHYSGQE